MEEKIKIVRVKIDQLKDAEYNPRVATDKEKEDLKESLKKFGFVEPIVVNSAPGRKDVIIGGHFRVRVAKEMGIEEVPVVYINISDLEKEKELNLRLNKNLGQWDLGLLKNFDEDFLKNVGFEDEELDHIFGLEMAEEFDEEKELAKAIKDPRGIKTGDIWKLGEHRLIIGDCTKREVWEKLLGEERFDFMFTDPPYRLAYCKKRTRKVKTKEGFKTKREREYQSVGETDKKGKPKGFGAKQDRIYDGIMIRGVPEYNVWLSIANEFQNPIGANVMVFENWKNIHDLWEAIEKYWKIKNIIIWHLPNRRQGFAARHQFFSKFDMAPLADKGKAPMNEQPEVELEEYLKEKGQKLLDTYEIIIYGKKEKSEWNRKSRYFKGSKWGEVSDHITWTASSEASTGQNLVFGTKPVQILIPYVKILSQRGGAEVILNRFERFTGIKAIKLN